MTPEEREAWILQLREDAQAGRRRIAERQAAREELAERAGHSLKAALEYDDLQRAERAAETQRRPAMQSDDNPDGLVFKRMDDALVTAAEGEADWSAWNDWWSGRMAVERRAQQDELVDALLMVENHLREEMRVALLKRDAEIAELRGQVTASLTLLQTKGADILDLRKSDWRRGA